MKFNNVFVILAYFICCLTFANAAVKLTLPMDYNADESSEIIYNVAQVKGMHITPESLKAHHTQHLKLDLGFAIRRGQEFDIIVRTDKKINLDKYTIVMGNDSSGKGQVKFQTLKVAPRKGDDVEYFVYKVTMTTPGESTPVGGYSKITLEVVPVEKGSAEKAEMGASKETFLYNYPFTVIILYNPWSKLDKKVYMDDNDVLQDTVVNDYGLVYDGSINNYRTIHWHYGPSEPVAIEAALHLIRDLTPDQRADPAEAVKAVSRKQGFTGEGGKAVGDPNNALLDGKWSGKFDDGVNPDTWTSSIDILNIWQKTKKPVKYGQCWVFGAIQTTSLRALGIPARQLSAFECRQDHSQPRSKDHKLHHVLDTYYDSMGTVVDNMGKSWNYHSWNLVWVNNYATPYERYNGWNHVDGTPPGLGPASVVAVRELNENETGGWNNTYEISNLKSAEREYLVECDAKEKGDKCNCVDKNLYGTETNCEIKKLIHFRHSGLKKVLSSTFDVETKKLAEDDVTLTLLNPESNAFIPFNNNEDDNDVSGSGSGQVLLDLSIVSDTDHTFVGDSIVNHVKIVMSRDYYTTSPDLSIAVRTSLTSRDKADSIEIMSPQNLVLDDFKQQDAVVRGNLVYLTSIPITVTPEQYLVRKNMIDSFVSMRVMLNDDNDDGNTLVASYTRALESPVIDLDYQRGAAGADGNDTVLVTASFKNPHAFVLENVCLSVHSHVLAFHSSNNNNNNTNTQKTVCNDLKPYQVLSLDATLVNDDTHTGPHHVFATVTGQYLPYTYENVVISV